MFVRLLLLAILLILVTSCEVHYQKIPVDRESDIKSSSSKKISTEEFKKLIQTVAEGNNEGNVAKVIGCFTKDAVYKEASDTRKFTPLEFFNIMLGTDEDYKAPLNMTWQRLSFQEEDQIGNGEYTFQRPGRYHATVLIKIRDGLISSWQEIRQRSDIEWTFPLK
jgi:hypothetical protein